MTLNVKKTIFFLWDLCLIFKTMCAFSDTSIASKAYLGYQVIVALIFCFTLIRCIKGLRENLGNEIIFCSQFFVILVVYGLIFSNPALSQEIGQQVKAMLLFYTASISMVLCLESAEDQLKFLKHSYYSMGTVVLIAFIFYNDGFQFISHMSDLFMRDERYRWEYGFYHANFVGNITSCLLLLSFVIYWLQRGTKKNKTYTKCLNVCVNLISVCMLLSSASRSNMIGLCFFVLLFVFINIENWIPVKKIYIKIIRTLIAMMAMIMFLFSESGNLYESLFKLSNRSLNFTINIPSLLASGREMFGIGYVDAGLFGAHKLPMNSWYVDNSFLYIFLTMGFVGLVWFVLLLIQIFVGIKKYDKTVKSGMAFTCVFITYLILGMSETCVFYPTFVSSFVYFVLLISCLFINKKIIE